MKYSPSNSSKWVAVEVQSCTIPLAYENRRDVINTILSLHQFQSILEEQMKVYDRLADERLGFTIVKEEGMVRYCNHFFNAND
ncbi:uncharacterized protein EV154DRAFT_460294 [Mucor mucedo]|uniref:uncharacterized protein n=1 Tax=Mucor mucedo TaxID=29922 RepID=UPI00221EB0F7|nr:uncharacterized protein EV154DRAFT_460294 [Mucor mucedo]KAI7893842.1 hypothetical protein EV154DRAFT_460294 [Mucor mucedo]